MSFPCTSCGACCKQIGTFKGGEDFALPNGQCKHLTEDNLCAIYATRPDACIMSKRAEKSYLFTEQTYYEYAAKVCNNMQEMQEIPVSFRLPT